LRSEARLGDAAVSVGVAQHVRARAGGLDAGVGRADLAVAAAHRGGRDATELAVVVQTDQRSRPTERAVGIGARVLRLTAARTAAPLAGRGVDARVNDERVRRGRSAAQRKKREQTRDPASTGQKGPFARRVGSCHGGALTGT
jgi:hypothetical protein